jgi:hypothetical protein
MGFSSFLSVLEDLFRFFSLHRMLIWAVPTTMVFCAALLFQILQRKRKKAKLLRYIARRTRPRVLKIRSYLDIAEGTLFDVHHFLSQEQFAVAEAYVMLPILQDLKSKGEALSRERKSSALRFVKHELKLREIVYRLKVAERRVKQMHRSPLTLEDVLEGRFNQDYVMTEGALP